MKKSSKLESVAVLLIDCPYRAAVTDTCDDVLFRLNMIFRVSVVLNRTVVVVDSD